MVFLRLRLVLPFVLLATLSRPAHADKIDDLARTLMQDPSYKVRVQAALVLGRLADKRTVRALIQALQDENESVRGVAAASLGRIGDKSAADALLQATNDKSDFVRIQAKKALEAIANAPEPLDITERSGAKFYLSIGFLGAGKFGDKYNRMIREVLAKDLQKIPGVTLSVGTRNEPSLALLNQKHLTGYLVDGTIKQLASVNQGGQLVVQCDLSVFVATFPDRSIKMMATQGAALEGVSRDPVAEANAKRDCIVGAAGVIREDVEKFLKTLN